MGGLVSRIGGVQRSLWAAVAVAVIGVALVVLGATRDPGAGQTVWLSIGSTLLSIGLISFVADVWLRGSLVRDTLDSAELVGDIGRAKLRGLQFDAALREPWITRVTRSREVFFVVTEPSFVQDVIWPSLSRMSNEPGPKTVRVFVSAEHDWTDLESRVRDRAWASGVQFEIRKVHGLNQTCLLGDDCMIMFLLAPNLVQQNGSRQPIEFASLLFENLETGLARRIKALAGYHAAEIVYARGDDSSGDSAPREVGDA